MRESYWLQNCPERNMMKTYVISDTNSFCTKGMRRNEDCNKNA